MSEETPNYWIIRLSCHTGDSETVIEALNNAGALGFYEILWEKENTLFSLNSDNSCYEFFFPAEKSKVEMELMFEILPLQLSEGELLDYELAMLGEKDFQLAYRRHFKPISITGPDNTESVRIVPPWEVEGQSQAGQLAAHPHLLVIQPAMAFGTGQHMSTRLMLQRLSELLPDESLQTVLDMGCGSGVLGLYAALHGCQVHGIDVSTLAVQNSNDNLALNRAFYPDIDMHITFECGDFDSEAAGRPIDLFIGNLTFGILSANRPALARLPCRRALFSGIIDRDRDAFIDILKEEGYSLIETREQEEWCLFDTRRD